MSRFLTPALAALEAYTPGEQPQRLSQYIKLNTNESPYPPAPSVRAALTDEVLQNLRLYPDPTAKTLKEKLAALYRVGPENVYLANGSDDILYFSFLAFCQDGAAFCDLTYGFYKVFADLVGVKTTVVPLREDLTVDVDGLCAADGTIFLANPNAPTGLALPLSDIRRLLASNPNRLVLVDEAYVDFGAESALSLLEEYDNLLVVRTFSKSRCLAGGRLGYAFAAPAVISDLETIRYSTNPYNINRLTLLLGEQTVEEEAYYVDCMKRVMNTRAECKKDLEELGFFVTDSRANFLFCKSEAISSAVLYEKLKARKILVRYFASGRASAYLRISVGTPQQMKTLVDTIKAILKENV